VTAFPKSNPTRDKAYRRWVASLPCAHCGLEGYSQAAHGPTLGRGIKADDKTCVPLCADSPGRVGCHAMLDQYKAYTREQRAELMAQWAQQTQKLWDAIAGNNR
jgi:hypothetical protein